MATLSCLKISSPKMLHSEGERGAAVSFPSRKPRHLGFDLKTGHSIMMAEFQRLIVQSSKSGNNSARFDKEKEGEQSSSSGTSDVRADDSGGVNTNPLMSKERMELRRKIRDAIAKAPKVKKVKDPQKKKKKLKELFKNYPLVVEEEDPNWSEYEDGWGVSLDQFFNKVVIKNERDDDEDYNSDEEIVWKDDNYIRPLNEITSSDWEATVFKDLSPLVILVHNRYKRPRKNERARAELAKAVHIFWETGWPSPRCMAIDAIKERHLVSALGVSGFPEIVFTKFGKILHRDKVVRTADEWSKMMAFFYYNAAQPSFIDKAVVQHQEKIPPFVPEITES